MFRTLISSAEIHMEEFCKGTQSIQPVEETRCKMKIVLPNFPGAKTGSPTSPEGAMASFGTSQTIKNIGNQMKKKNKLKKKNKNK